MSVIVPSDNPSIFAALKSLSTLDQQAIVRPNNPPPGVAGYLFDIVGDEDTDLTSEITDHFLEDNTAIQDHIALRPEQVTLRGIVAELVKTTPPLSQTVPSTNPLPLNSTMIPSRTSSQSSQAALTAQTSAAESASVTSGKSLYGYFDQRSAKQPNQTKQSKIFNYFYQLWKGRQLFSVETPNGIWTNMAILTLQSLQGEDSKYKTDFVVTFKKIRIAGQVSVAVGQLAGRLNFEQSPTSQNGTAGSPTVSNNRSLLRRMINPSP